MKEPIDKKRWIFPIVLILILIAGYQVGKDRAIAENQKHNVGAQ